MSTDESLHLLATCYFRSDKVFQAYDLLRKRGAATPKNKFLLAKCCQRLKKNAEAEAVLAGDSSLDPRASASQDDMTAEFGDAAGFALQMLASLYGQSERVGKANECDRKALKLNPFLWKSFEALCRRGDAPDPAQVFTVAGLDNFSQCHGVNHILSLANGGGAATVTATTAATAESPQTTTSPAATTATTAVAASAPTVAVLSAATPSITVTSTPNVHSASTPGLDSDSSMHVDPPQFEGTPLNPM